MRRDSSQKLSVKDRSRAITSSFQKVSPCRCLWPSSSSKFPPGAPVKRMVEWVFTIGRNELASGSCVYLRFFNSLYVHGQVNIFSHFVIKVLLNPQYGKMMLRQQLRIFLILLVTANLSWSCVCGCTGCKVQRRDHRGWAEDKCGLLWCRGQHREVGGRVFI